MKKAAQFLIFLSLVFLSAWMLSKMDRSTTPTTSNQIEWVEVPPDETVANQ